MTIQRAGPFQYLKVLVCLATAISLSLPYPVFGQVSVPSDSGNREHLRSVQVKDDSDHRINPTLAGLEEALRQAGQAVIPSAETTGTSIKSVARAIPSNRTFWQTRLQMEASSISSDVPSPPLSATGLEESQKDRDVRVGRFLLSLAEGTPSDETLSSVKYNLPVDDQRFLDRMITAIQEGLRLQQERIGSMLGQGDLASMLLLDTFNKLGPDGQHLKQVLHDSEGQYSSVLDPGSGVVQVWVSAALFSTVCRITGGEFPPQAMAIKTPKAGGGVSFILLQAKWRQNQTYREETIPHEVAHVFFQFMKDGGILSSAETDTDWETAFQAFREEVVAKMFGGRVRPFGTTRVLKASAEKGRRIIERNVALNDLLAAIQQLIQPSPYRDDWPIMMIWPVLKTKDYDELEAILKQVKAELEQWHGTHQGTLEDRPLFGETSVGQAPKGRAVAESTGDGWGSDVVETEVAPTRPPSDTRTTVTSGLEKGEVPPLREGQVRDSSTEFSTKGGWKLHLAVAPEDYQAVHEWLWKNTPSYGYKHLYGGEEGAEDFTVYVGSKRDVDELARKISTEMGHLLLEQMSSFRRGVDIQLAPKVLGRFDTNKAVSALDDFGYGTYGVPFPKGDHYRRLGPLYAAKAQNPGNEGIVQELQKLEKELARQGFEILQRERGEYFTGGAASLEELVRSGGIPSAGLEEGVWIPTIEELEKSTDPDARRLAQEAKVAGYSHVVLIPNSLREQAAVPDGLTIHLYAQKDVMAGAVAVLPVKFDSIVRHTIPDGVQTAREELEKVPEDQRTVVALDTAFKDRLHELLPENHPLTFLLDSKWENYMNYRRGISVLLSQPPKATRNLVLSLSAGSVRPVKIGGRDFTAIFA